MVVSFAIERQPSVSDDYGSVSGVWATVGKGIGRLVRPNPRAFTFGTPADAITRVRTHVLVMDMPYAADIRFNDRLRIDGALYLVNDVRNYELTRQVDLEYRD